MAYCASDRSFVIFRDPRDVILSSYKMRTEVMQQEDILPLSLEEYIRKTFEVSVKKIRKYIWN